MSKLTDFINILNQDFISKDSFLSEPEAKMRINLNKQGCKSFIFVLDQKLSKDYKGGMFPFFNKSLKKVCKVCDYIIFAEKDGKLYSLVIELKKKQTTCNSQLDAGICFTNYIKDTVNRVNKKDYSLTIRKVVINRFKGKNTTKYNGISYDLNGKAFFSSQTFFLKEFLK